MRKLLPFVLMASSIVFAQAHQSRDAQLAMERSRRENERPSDIVRLIGVLPGMRVGEVGAGSGYFIFFLSEQVGPSEVVYANDIKADSLNSLEANARKSAAPNRSPSAWANSSPMSQHVTNCAKTCLILTKGAQRKTSHFSLEMGFSPYVRESGAMDSGSKGRRFESSQARHLFSPYGQ